MNDVMETYGNLKNVKIMTIAPEIDGALETIKDLKENGIVVSIGRCALNKLCTKNFQFKSNYISSLSATVLEASLTIFESMFITHVYFPVFHY